MSTDSIVYRDGKRISLSEDVKRLEENIKQHNNEIADRVHTWTIAATGAAVVITILIVFLSAYFDTRLRSWVAGTIAISCALVIGPLIAYSANRWLKPGYMHRRSISTVPEYYNSRKK